MLATEPSGPLWGCCAVEGGGELAAADEAGFEAVGDGI